MIDIDDKVKAMFYLCNLAFTAADTEGVCSFSSAVQFEGFHKNMTFSVSQPPHEEEFHFQGLKNT